MTFRPSLVFSINETFTVFSINETFTVASFAHCSFDVPNHIFDIPNCSLDNPKIDYIAASKVYGP